MGAAPNGFATRAQLVISACAVASPAFAGIVYLYIENARLEQKQLETETQLCAIEQTRNLMHVNDLRITSLLWKKVYGQDYPASTVYTPTICNRSTP